MTDKEGSSMKQTSKIIMMIVTLLSCVGCDQVTNNIARQTLVNGESISFFNNIFRFQYTENPGAFLSLGAGANEQTRFLIFSVITGLFLIGMVCYLMISKKVTKTEVLAFSMVIGGGFANLIDRVFNNGRVIDFMNMGIGPIRTGIFNVADVAIFLGTFWIFALLLKRQETRGHN
jgi:signal peptidase II